MVSSSSPRGTLLNISLVEEKYGRSIFASIGLHLGLFVFIWLGPYLFPSISAIQLGTGPGGGLAGDTYSVGVADDLGGGAGMIKPSVIPQPPAMPEEKQIKEENKQAVALPDTVPPKKKPQRAVDSQQGKKVPAANPDIVPTAPEPGAGGSGGLAGGSGGGRGGGVGVSIGAGSGGQGDSWYARVVEARISSNWIRPAPGVQLEIVYSFFIAADGSIYNIRKEKSSGNDALDLAAERAIRASNPLAAPPPEMRSRPIQFVAQFIYPPGT